MSVNTYSGQILYHYTDRGGLLGILNGGSIRATEIRDLADETELVYGRDLVAHGFERRARKHPALKETVLRCARATRRLPNISELIREYGDDPIKDDAEFRWFVTCFSEQRDALPLWRGFTSRCTGYALGLRYKSNPEEFLSDFVHYPPQRVIYGKAAERTGVTETVNNAIRVLDDEIDKYAWTIPLGNVLYLKSQIFSTEREWRVIVRQSDHAPLIEHETGLKGRQPNRRTVRYVEVPLNDWVLEEIICGPRALFGLTLARFVKVSKHLAVIPRT